MSAIAGYSGGDQVVEGEGMSSLRSIGKRTEQKPTDEVPFYFRGPKALKDYVAASAKEQDKEQGKFIMDAIELDRDLGAKLRPHEERLLKYATSQSLTFDRDIAEVLARLVVLGLESAEKPEKNHKK